MAAARRFVTDIGPTCSAFARTVLLETWRALLPDTLPLARPLSLADRLRLVRAEVLDLTDASTVDTGSDGRIGAGSLAVLWHSVAGDVPVAGVAPSDEITGSGAVGVSVSAAVALGIDRDDLAAAVTATAGELGAARIVVFCLDPRDGRSASELVRAFRRITSLQVEIVVHDLSTDITVARLAACTRFVTVDPVAAAVARSVGVRTVRLDAADDLTALFTALQTGADLDQPDDRRARDLAFALDAWQRGRSSTAALWSSVRRVDSTDDLVVA